MWNSYKMWSKFLEGLKIFGPSLHNFMSCFRRLKKIKLCFIIKDTFGKVRDVTWNSFFSPMHGRECICISSLSLYIYIAVKHNEFKSLFPFFYIFLYLQNSPTLETHKNETLVEAFSLKTLIYFAMYLSSQLWGYLNMHIFMSCLTGYTQILVIDAYILHGMLMSLFYFSLSSFVLSILFF